MTIEELNREFGPQIVSDALLVGVMGQLGEKPTFTKRQEICRQQMETALKQSLEQQQQAEAFRARVKQQAEELLAQLDPQSTPMFVLREPGACEYYTETDQHGGKRLPVFTTPAFVDDFLTERRLTCEPEEITVSQLCTAEEKRPSADIASISINLCPRCGEGAMLKREHRDDHEQLLRLYAATVAGKSLCVARELEAALQREDLQQRLAALKNIINHIDPGAPRVHQEIIQAAKAVGDAAALERSTAALLKYAPSAMA